MANGFDIDLKRLRGVCSSVLIASEEGRGIFRGGRERWTKRYLPQWNIPKELEYNPQRIEVAKPFEASNFLSLEVQLERQNQSRYLMKKLLQIWDDKEKRWLFEPDEVASRPFSLTEEIIEGDIRYKIAGTNEKKPAVRIYENAVLLVNNYSGDSRKLVEGMSVEQARENLRQFQGIGPGIVNLYIMYLLDRKIASPLDPENILFKIDVHKGRIPINTGCISLKNGAKDVHVNSLVAKFEQAYKEVCRTGNFDPAYTDSALWVLGSEVCAKRSYQACWNNCPLMHNNLCLSNVPLQQTKGAGSGRFVIFDEHWNRMETRRKEEVKPQRHFFF